MNIIGIITLDNYLFPLRVGKRRFLKKSISIHISGYIRFSIQSKIIITRNFEIIAFIQCNTHQNMVESYNFLVNSPLNYMFK